MCITLLLAGFRFDEMVAVSRLRLEVLSRTRLLPQRAGRTSPQFLGAMVSPGTHVMDARIRCPHCHQFMSVNIVSADPPADEQFTYSRASGVFVDEYVGWVEPAEFSTVSTSSPAGKLHLERRVGLTRTIEYFEQRAEELYQVQRPGQFIGFPAPVSELDYDLSYLWQTGPRKGWHFWFPNDGKEQFALNHENFARERAEAVPRQSDQTWYEFWNNRFDREGLSMVRHFGTPMRLDFHRLCPGVWQRWPLLSRHTEHHRKTYPKHWPPGKEMKVMFHGTKVELIWSLVLHDFWGSDGKWGTRTWAGSEKRQVFGYAEHDRDIAARRYSRGVSLNCSKLYQLCVAEAVYYEDEVEDDRIDAGSSRKRPRSDPSDVLAIDVDHVTLVAVWTCDVHEEAIAECYRDLAVADAERTRGWIYMLQSFWDSHQEFPATAEKLILAHSV